MDKKLTEASKFLSYVLRHGPQSIELDLDSEGWADIDALIAGASRHGRAIDREMIETITAQNDKKRFSISDDGRCIRAAQGHTTAAVAIAYEPVVPPDWLFHGTATRFLDAIQAEGLNPGKRHHVHLSANVETAVAVGQRHGKPVVLFVDAGAMHAQGFVFYQADNLVWLAEGVPARFLGVVV